VTTGTVIVDDPTHLNVEVALHSRAVPMPTPESEAFWQGLAEDRLILACCGNCGRFTHYPVAGCSWCGSPDQHYEQVEPVGTIYSYTVCALPFGPGLTCPYVVAAVEPDSQPGLKLITNIVNCRIADVRIGLPVSGRFVHDDPHHLLVFEPRLLTPYAEPGRTYAHTSSAQPLTITCAQPPVAAVATAPSLAHCPSRPLRHLGRMHIPAVDAAC
jgi:uncharacterized OB-fold protein